MKGFSSGVLQLGKQGALDVSPDGRLVACGWQDNTVRVWDLSTGAETVTLEDMSRRHPVICVAISPDGELVAASFATWTSTPAGEMEIGAWSLKSGRRVFERRFSTTRVSLAWAQVPGYLFTGGPDEMLRLWHLDQQDPVTVFAARPGLILSQGPTTVAVEESGEVFILELTGARPRSG